MRLNLQYIEKECMLKPQVEVELEERLWELIEDLNLIVSLESFNWKLQFSRTLTWKKFESRRKQDLSNHYKNWVCISLSLSLYFHWACETRLINSSKTPKKGGARMGMGVWRGELGFKYFL